MSLILGGTALPEDSLSEREKKGQEKRYFDLRTRLRQ